VNADHLLGAASRLLESGAPGTRGRWPRASALLIRVALEIGLDEFWSRAEPAAARCGMRPQLLLLASYVDRETALLAREAWTGLASAGHHHPYELAPTAAELRTWYAGVTTLLRRLRAAPGRYAAAGAPGSPTTLDKS
jgi:hypothetical protein